MHTLITEKSAWVLGKQSSYMSGTCEEAIDDCCRNLKNLQQLYGVICGFNFNFVESSISPLVTWVLRYLRNGLLKPTVTRIRLTHTDAHYCDQVDFFGEECLGPL